MVDKRYVDKRYVEDYVNEPIENTTIDEYDDIKACIEQIDWIIELKRELFPNKQCIKNDIRELKKEKKQLQLKLSLLEGLIRG